MIEIKFIGGNGRTFLVSESENPWSFFAEKLQEYDGYWTLNIQEASEKSPGFQEWLRADSAIRRMVAAYGTDGAAQTLREVVEKANNMIFDAVSRRG